MLYNCQVTLYYHTPDGRPGRGKSFFTTPKEQLDALNLPTPSRHRTQGKGDRGIQFRWHINDLGAVSPSCSPSGKDALTGRQIVRHNILAVMNARAVGEMQESLQRFGMYARLTLYLLIYRELTSLDAITASASPTSKFTSLYPSVPANALYPGSLKSMCNTQRIPKTRPLHPRNAHA